MKKYIGVLGGNGIIGQNIIKELLKIHDEKILVGLREKKNNINSENIEYLFFDLKDEKNLRLFISKCHIIINCTGIISQVAQFCIKEKSHYIDVSGDEKTVEILQKLDYEFKKENLCCVHSVGANPGLSEAFLYHFFKEKVIKKAKVYFSGVGKLSFSAVSELLDTSMESSNFAGCYIKNNEIKKLDYFISHEILPNPLYKSHCVPIITRSFYECIKKLKFNESYFYNAFSNQEIISALIESKISYEESKRKEIISKLKESFNKYSTLFEEEFSLFHISYIENTLEKEMGYFYSSDWNKLTSLVAVLVAISIFSNKNNGKYGVGEIYTFLDLNYFFKNLQKNEFINIYL